jgi:hypothetical protein
MSLPTSGTRTPNIRLRPSASICVLCVPWISIKANGAAQMLGSRPKA